MASSGALILFARQPRVGTVKTRLAVKLGDVAATEIYARLLSRTILLAEASRCANRYLFTADPTEVDYFIKRLEPECWQVCTQCQGDIGQRMHTALETVLDRHDFVVLIGSDVADCKVGDLDDAWTTLERGNGSAVIGPSADGGYWLLGVHQVYPIIFNDIPWSTDEVLPMTLARMASIGLEVVSLNPRHDIDEFEDLRFLEPAI